MDLIKRAQELIKRDGIDRYTSYLYNTELQVKEKVVKGFLKSTVKKEYEISQKLASEIIIRDSIDSYKKQLLKYYLAMSKSNKRNLREVSILYTLCDRVEKLYQNKKDNQNTFNSIKKLTQLLLSKVTMYKKSERNMLSPFLNSEQSYIKEVKEFSNKDLLKASELSSEFEIKNKENKINTEEQSETTN